MPLSKQMRLLQTKWTGGSGWPKRLEWIEIAGIRGWSGQRIEFKFPMIALCGENGSGKSTILQSAAAVYSEHRNQTDWYASDFFPETPWDSLLNAEIRYSVRQGPGDSKTGKLQKFSDRWKGYIDRPVRVVQYDDLARIQPISSRTGFARLAKPTAKESSANVFDSRVIARMSQIMGRNYTTAKMALTDLDNERMIPVVAHEGQNFSGFHQGAGEFTVVTLMGAQFQRHSLVLIDEIETSLHPRAQRRLIRDLADLCREREFQIILTTHSPYVLDEFPEDARGYIMQSSGKKDVVFGISPEFSMTKMDDEAHPEWDLYVEDDRAKTVLSEILVAHAPGLLDRAQIISYGAANVGRSLGQMIIKGKFPRKSLVFLDGDQERAEGCILLPGGDAPERVVFAGLKDKGWLLLPMRASRDFSEVVDACNRAMTTFDHHLWVGLVARELRLGSDSLWQMMCSSWAESLQREEVDPVVEAVQALALD